MCSGNKVGDGANIRRTHVINPTKKQASRSTGGGGGKGDRKGRGAWRAWYCSGEGARAGSEEGLVAGRREREGELWSWHMTGRERRVSVERPLCASVLKPSYWWSPLVLSLHP